jgi:FkbM family methyltransferase
MSRVAMVLDRYRRTYGMPKGLLLLALRYLRIGTGTPVRAVARPGAPDRPLVRANTSDEMAYFQVFQKLDYEIDIGSSVATIIDAGANVGYASLWFAERFPQAQILAIEPDPENFALLVRNTRAYPRIRSVQAALSDTEAWVSLFDPGIGPWGIRVAAEPDVTADGAGAIVKAISVPTAIELLGSDVVDLLKIDIEGSEREVLATSSDWIDRVNAVFVEIHESWAPGAQKVYDEAVEGFDELGKLGENRYAIRAAANRRVP